MSNVPGLKRRGNSWQFRRRVPDGLREHFGKREFVESLTACPASDAAKWARRRWVYYDAQIEAASEPSAPSHSSVSEAEIREIAIRYFLSLEEAASMPFLEADVEELDEQNVEELVALGATTPEDPAVQQVARAAARAAGGNDSISGKDFYRLSQWVYEACLEHHLRQSDRIGRGPEVVRNPAFSPESIARVMGHEQGATSSGKMAIMPPLSGDSMPPVSIMSMFEAYIRERQPAPATVKSWRLKLEKLVAFLGHDEADRVTADDLINWKDHLASAPTARGKRRSAKTVREGYLAAAKTVFNYAAENRKIATNPAVGVKMRGRKRQRMRDAGFSQDEAEAILIATFVASNSRITRHHALARRWVPWICAYTGARVGEITQLRKQDVVEIDGVWAIDITPEAGSVKTDARKVPLHSHLIEQGFLQVVAATEDGPLFYNPSLARGGSTGNPQHKKTAERLGSWVRELGVDDPNVQPNHGWRHRFKTVARGAKMDHEAREVIPGHSLGSEGAAYGSWTLPDLKAEIEKLPRYEVELTLRGLASRTPTAKTN